jgi:hypothetical protein
LLVPAKLRRLVYSSPYLLLFVGPSAETIILFLWGCDTSKPQTNIVRIMKKVLQPIVCKNLATQKSFQIYLGIFGALHFHSSKLSKYFDMEGVSDQNSPFVAEERA